MNFYEHLLKNYPLSGTPYQQSVLLNDFENALFDACPWILEMDEDAQNEIVEFLFGKWHTWQRRPA